MTILSLLLLSLALAAAQTRSSNITLGSSLTPTTNSSWLSPSGLYAFGFFPQHVGTYAVGVFLSDRTVVWTANRDNPTVPSDVVSLQLTDDGRLILRRGQGQGQDVDVINTPQAIASASMLDNGNFVLYSSDSGIIWQSFDNPTNTLLPGQRLRPGQELFSSASETDYSKGIFRLKMQSDGNLVQYPVNTPDAAAYAYFATNLGGIGNNVSLNFDDDGRLHLLNGSVPLQNITAGRYTREESIYLARLDVGGIFRLYSRSSNLQGNWTVRWSSTDDPCIPKGFCGVNSFCTLMDNVPECQCLPGFGFVQSGNYSAGCSRSFTAQSCREIDHKLAYEIRDVDNTVWYDNSYDVLNTVSEEQCRQACLDDCNCEAAFFKDSRCSKQSLPLRYGRRSMGDSNMALVRVSTATPERPETEGTSSSPVKERRIDVLIIGIVFMAVGALAVSISVTFVHWKRRGYTKVAKVGEVNLVEDVSLQAFTFEDLSRATNDFSEELGRGASGTVYKGVLQDSKKLVAVKRLEKEVAEGDRVFRTELTTIGKTYHRNLVRLLGYCLDETNKLLVFEHMSNGSLAEILFKPDNRPRWEERVKLARDISRGILYLHEECETQIIHCDIKPQNILMDGNWCAKISDFGIAKLLKQDQTNTTTGIRGTRGYVAPEWYQKQPVTVKADVYSFGIMLLEMISCRRSVDWSLCEDEAVLEDWVYQCYAAGEVGKLVVDEIIDKREVERMVKIGIWCVQYEASLRPTMKKVVLMLEGTVDIPIPPSPTSFLSSM